MKHEKQRQQRQINTEDQWTGERKWRKIDKIKKGRQ